MENQEIQETPEQRRIKELEASYGVAMTANEELSAKIETFSFEK